MNVRILSFTALLLLLVGCHTTPITNIQTKQVENQTQRLQTIGAVATVQKETIDAKDLGFTAKLNTNILQLAEAPTTREVEEVRQSLKDNTSLNKRIDALVEDKRSISTEKDAAIAALTKKNEELKKLEDPFEALKYGFTTLFKRFLYTISAIGIIYGVARMFASSNPLASAILSIFEHIAAYCIKAITFATPKAVELGSKVFQNKDETLEVLVDSISTLNDTNTIADLKDALAKDMDATHKQTVYDIKKRLKWK